MRLDSSNRHPLPEFFIYTPFTTRSCFPRIVFPKVRGVTRPDPRSVARRIGHLETRVRQYHFVRHMTISSLIVKNVRNVRNTGLSWPFSLIVKIHFVCPKKQVPIWHDFVSYVTSPCPSVVDQHQWRRFRGVTRRTTVHWKWADEPWPAIHRGTFTPAASATSFSAIGCGGPKSG